jgi:aspartate aminotransferase
MKSLYQLAPRLQNVEASPTVRLNGLAQEMIKNGKDVVNLTAGETDFATPESVQSAAIDAIRSGMSRYTASHGIPELRKAVSAWFQRDFDLSYDWKQVTVTVGVKQGLFNLILALVGEGDEVIIPSPYWVSYPEMVRIAGGKPVILPASESFSLDLAAIQKAIQPRTRLLLLNSPNNPCGGMYGKKELAALAKLLEGTNVLVAADEIYSSLVYDGEPFVSFAALSDDAYKRTITFNGLSKSHAMTGWRVGFAAGPTEIIEAMGILQAQSSTHIPSFIQPAAIEALKQESKDFLPRLVDMQQRRDFCLGILQKISHLKVEVPKGAFYLFPDVSAHLKAKGWGSEKLAEHLLLDAGVAVVPGKPFGDDNKIRISFAKDRQSLEKGFDRIRVALQKILP